MVNKYYFALVGGLFLCAQQLQGVISYSSWNKPNGAAGTIVIAGLRHDFDEALSTVVHEKIARLNAEAEAGKLGFGRLHHLVEFCDEHPYAFQLFLNKVDHILHGMWPYFLAESPENFHDEFQGDMLLQLYERQYGKKPEKCSRVVFASIDSRGTWGIAFQYLKSFMSKKKIPNTPFYEEAACDQLQFFAQRITISTIFDLTKKIEKYELMAKTESAGRCFKEIKELAEQYNYYAWQRFVQWAQNWSIPAANLEDSNLDQLIDNAYAQGIPCLQEFEACLHSEYLTMSLKMLVNAEALWRVLELSCEDNAMVWVGALHASNIEKYLECLGFTCADNTYRLHYQGAVAATIRDACLAFSEVPPCNVPSNFMYSFIGRDSCCASCAVSDKNLSSCGRCGTVKYCSKDCQRTDWKLHKSKCIKK